MNIGKPLFAQIIDFIPWTTFARYVERYGRRSWDSQPPLYRRFRTMAFAQLAYRESLRAIEVCLTAQVCKLYPMGLRHLVRRATLADAISRGGSTLRDFVGSDGQSGYFQLEAFVYDRAGLPCRVCGTPIRQIVQGQRSTFYCPSCQR